MKCNPPISTPQASDQPSKRKKWKQSKQVLSLDPMNSQQSDLLSVPQWTGVMREGICTTRKLQLIRHHFTHILSRLLREQRFNGHIRQLNWNIL